MESYKFQAKANAVAVKLDERLYTECSLDAVRREPLPILCGAGEVFWHYQDRYKTSYAIDKIGAFLNTYDTKESFQFKSAIRKVNYATPAAEFCVAIIESFALMCPFNMQRKRGERTQQEWGEVFLEYVLMFCRELFNSRDEVLRPPDQPTIRSRRWVAYVSFLAELLDGLSDAQAENTARPCRTGGAYATKARRMLVLATLICVSCQTMLQPPSLYNPTEMECLRTALITAGAALEHEAPERLAAVMREVQAALETQRLPIRSRQVLQELMELKASAWQQTPSEQTYVSTATSR
ncbi:hypothetical protein HPB52_022203 [Rhipicephalus sanguineus]|uniref:Uncharacterized protein n=1 Tax=Rhipicephalus sanguineus TaxID=34632 RepID=A0A9D4STD5_RHISA|nr:hypothetical protein HPB52_022203 [Rhipicephalus sanguineus]